jgi:hypothetical protein
VLVRSRRATSTRPNILRSRRLLVTSRQAQALARARNNTSTTCDSHPSLAPFPVSSPPIPSLRRSALSPPSLSRTTCIPCNMHARPLSLALVLVTLASTHAAVLGAALPVVSSLLDDCSYYEGASPVSPGLARPSLPRAALFCIRPCWLTRLVLPFSLFLAWPHGGQDFQGEHDGRVSCRSSPREMLF